MKIRNILVALVAAIAVPITTAMPAQAATITFTQLELNATVTGTSVVTSAKIKANTDITVDRYGIALYKGDVKQNDMVKDSNVLITTTGTTVTSPATTLAPGTYKYQIFVHKPGSADCNCLWKQVGVSKPFTVTADGGTGTGTGTNPTIGTLEDAPTSSTPNFTRRYTEDFKTTAAPGLAYSVYKNSIASYGNTSIYKEANVSAHDGVLDVNLPGSAASVNPATGAVVVFGPPETVWGQTYGKFSMRFKVTGANGTGAAFMLWPSSDNWAEKEIDFPEGHFNDQLNLFEHTMNCDYSVPKKVYCGNFVAMNTNASWYDWHTTSIEWTPNSIKYYLDGTLVRTTTTTNELPHTKHRWMVQIADPDHNARSSAPGHVYFDWATKDDYTPAK